MKARCSYRPDLPTAAAAAEDWGDGSWTVDCSYGVNFNDGEEMVQLLSETDVLATAHGTQMTNMIFMERNSSVMEFYPMGWKEMASSQTGLGRGTREPGVTTGGLTCKGTTARLECFTSFKDCQIGHDVIYFSKSGKIIN